MPPIPSSGKSYSQIVKEYSPLHTTGRRSTSVTDIQDEWTDVSSMASCSWPNSVDEEGMCLYYMIALSPHPLIAQRVVCRGRHGIQDECPVDYRDDQYLEEYFCAEEGSDTRAKCALVSKVYRTRRSCRLYNEVMACFKAAKPWRPFPGKLPCHRSFSGAASINRGFRLR